MCTELLLLEMSNITNDIRAKVFFGIEGSSFDIVVHAAHPCSLLARFDLIFFRILKSISAA